MSEIEIIVANLSAVATPERATYEKNYHKSSLTFLGANVPAQSAEARRILRENKQIDRAAMLTLFGALWETDVHELRGVACSLLCLRSRLLIPQDMAFLKEKIKESKGWAHVDTLAAKPLADLVLSHGLEGELDEWAIDEDFWIRRASMLALLKRLSAGDMGEWPRFTRYAEGMLCEKEFFIRKAIGWVLREVSKKNPNPVFDFLHSHRNAASGLTLREGAKHLPPEMRDQLGLRA